MAITLSTLSVAGLKMAINLKQKIESLTQELEQILRSSVSESNGTNRKNRMSAAGRARIAAAQKARWAKAKGKTGKRKMSAEGRAKIAAAAKKRWKVAKAAGKTRL